MKRIYIKNSPIQVGFTLIELLIVMAVLGVLATMILLIINPSEQMAKARDTGRISAIQQLGRALVGFQSTRNNTFPDINTWSQELVTTGEIATFPAGIIYSINNLTNCQTNTQPATDPTYCYDLDISGSDNGAIVFAKLESKTQVSKCDLVGDTYFVFSTTDGKAGIICNSGDPTPWAAGYRSYLE